ncbi:MAG: mechanosensitive ion channel family protein [Candidatus Eisenbacteria bacterium]|jgi:small-conductance mechanosensitive channel|nr:mechanosensitive ion channel family protein [Candidatus Eisenbacteria bacterium]
MSGLPLLPGLTGWASVLDHQNRLLASLLLVLLLWLTRSVILRAVLKQTTEPRTRYAWQKGSGYAVASLAAVLLVLLWVESLRSIATMIGILTAGLAIALRDLLVNLAGWLFIISRRPFGLGDRIQIGSHRGDVIDIRLFQFTLMEIGNWVDADQSTGRIIHVPNGMVLTTPLANYSRGFHYVWNEMPVLITFESNWQAAKGILLRVAEAHAEHLTDEARRRVIEASSRFMIFYTKLTPIIYTSVKDSGVLLTMRYLTDPKHRRDSEHAIWESVLTEFGQRKDIEFAYPTWRAYVRGEPPPQGESPAFVPPPPS